MSGSICVTGVSTNRPKLPKSLGSDMAISEVCFAKPPARVRAKLAPKILGRAVGVGVHQPIIAMFNFRSSENLRLRASLLRREWVNT